MDIRSKLKLFNDEILVSISCVDDSGSYLFNSWHFPKTVDSSYCGVLASQEWTEACAFFKKIEACGFLYRGSCGLSVSPDPGTHLIFSCDGCFSVKARDLTIGSCNRVDVNSVDVITLYTNVEDKVPTYIQIGNYESQDKDKIGVKAYGEDVVISSKNNTSIDSRTLDISSDGELNISAGETIHINTYCIEMGFINVSTFSTFDGSIYFKPDSSIEVCGNAYFKGNITRFDSSPTIENVIITQDNQLVPKSYVDNATAKKLSCTYTDTEEHTISIGNNGICFSPENIKIHGCSGALQIYGMNDSGLNVCVDDISLSVIPYANNNALCLTDGFGDDYLATEAYVNAKKNEKSEVISIGCEAWTVDIKAETYDSISFNETKLPTTGGTVATQDYVEESIKSLPYTCIYNLGECTPVNGIASWEITLMCGDQLVKSIIPPHVSILKNDPSTILGGTYVNADVSVYTMDDVGIPSETRIKIEMNTTETVPANTFKAVVSNIYARCF